MIRAAALLAFVMTEPLPVAARVAVLPAVTVEVDGCDVRVSVVGGGAADALVVAAGHEVPANGEWTAACDAPRVEHWASMTRGAR